MALVKVDRIRNGSLSIFFKVKHIINERTKNNIKLSKGMVSQIFNFHK